MTKTFTENDLIRFLYDELTEYQKSELNQALAADPDLQERLNDLSDMINDLDQIRVRPTNKTLSKILDFSRNFEVHSA